MWALHSDFFSVGAQFAPAGVPAARSAVRARLAGDTASAVRHACQAMEADQYANEKRAAGVVVRRANVVGNAWSGWFEAITGRPSGW